jgi:hypothetical protein
MHVDNNKSQNDWIYVEVTQCAWSQLNVTAFCIHRRHLRVINLNVQSMNCKSFVKLPAKLPTNHIHTHSRLLIIAAVCLMVSIHNYWTFIYTRFYSVIHGDTYQGLLDWHSGEKAEIWTPFCWQNLMIFSLLKYGWTSIYKRQHKTEDFSWIQSIALWKLADSVKQMHAIEISSPPWSCLMSFPEEIQLVFRNNMWATS